VIRRNKGLLMNTTLHPDQIKALGNLDTCTVANAIESFRVRLFNEGFCDASIRCFFPELPPMVGYAVPLQIRCSAPPPNAQSYLDRTDWWDYVQSIPSPRVVVVQDTDPQRGLGSLLGEVHAGILQALECVGAVTDGSVRDLPDVAAMGFHFFAGNVTTSHAYAHIVNIGEPVEIGGLRINPGDLLHGDRHGVLSIPTAIAADIPAIAAKLIVRERELLALCRSGDFSMEKLRAFVKAG
jgi:regulator of RNase E activity RraA